MNEPLHAVPFLLASTASVLVCVIASSGLRCTIPTTNISFAVLKPMLPNQCTPELHRLEPDAWPCVRDGASQYIQRVVATDGWQHIQGPGLKYFLMFLSYFGPWLLIAVVHYLERYFERSTRVYRVEDEVVVAEAEELPREGTGGEKDDANPKQLPNERA
ncbi:hypothetical protein DOTSEDRAFT_74083 [Dothistroma septosporum NZE10]|uniref:Uncharacterized protein n=1 Tax=Dothistroma septosporum (strain NZE10 / CBS 128990) TaxID=675120 RepID=N1PIF8_DOTSN|nr:hypothetical protein DOTSEDRAFT_74083 [Dothistroma septosporum NZE10]